MGHTPVLMDGEKRIVLELADRSCYTFGTFGELAFWWENQAHGRTVLAVSLHFRDNSRVPHQDHLPDGTVVEDDGRQVSITSPRGEGAFGCLAHAIAARSRRLGRELDHDTQAWWASQHAA